MSGSGLIYAAIAILWAAVLIPMWLRNHDTATENRSAERFGQAMRVLSRGGQRSEHADEEHDEYDESSRSVSDLAAAAPRPTRSQVKKTQPTRDRREREVRAPLTLAQRRARSLGVLAGLTLFTVVLSLITPLPWWSAAPFVVLLGAFVVHLRVQARQKLQRHRPTRSAAQSATQAATSDESRGTVASAKSVESVASGESRDATVVQGPSRAVVVERKGASRPAAHAAEDDEEAWQPNPLPLPTYVTAPKAVRPIKVIDLTTPGAWTSGRLLDDDLADEDLLAAQVAEDELDALLEQEIVTSGEASDEEKRRAVGD